MTACPYCERKMITESSGLVLTVNPPIRTLRHWCQCGYRGEWFQRQDPTEDELMRRAQDRLNDR